MRTRSFTALDALSDPDRAHDPPAVRDGHRAVQEILAERVAVALPWAVRPASAVRSPACSRTSARRRPAESAPQHAVRIDDDHARAELLDAARDRDPPELRARFIEPEACAATMCAWPAASFSDLGVDAAPEVERERYLERDHDQQEPVREGQEQPEPEAHSSSGEAKRKPTPRMVCRNRGSLESSPSLRRSPLTCTSSVFVEPNQFVSQTSSNACSRVTTEPAFCISSWRSSNSFRLSSSTLAVLRHLALGRVQAELADLDRLGLVGPGAIGTPEHGSNARDHLACAEGLDHVVVGAELEPDDAVRLLAAGGEHDDRHLGALS